MLATEDVARIDIISTKAVFRFGKQVGVLASVRAASTGQKLNNVLTDPWKRKLFKVSAVPNV